MIKKTIVQRGILAIGAVFSLTLALPLIAAAEEMTGTNETEHTTTTTSDSSAMQKQEALKRAEQEKAAAAAKAKLEEQKTKLQAAKGRLTEAKKKVCDARKKNITTLMSKNGENAQKHFNQITTISERVQKFYSEKGKVLSNYDALVSDVNAKKALAQASVDALKASSATFDCSAENPKGTLDAFKTDLKSKTTALIDYRAAVKKLIVGVKSVQGKTESTTGGNE